MATRKPLELSRRDILKAGGVLAAAPLLDACCRIRVSHGTPAVFDAHVHLFDLHYLFLEAGAVLWDQARGAYPAGLEVPKEALAAPRGTPHDLFLWIQSLAAALHGPERDNLCAAQKGLRKALPPAEAPAVIALSMDIYYLFAPTVGPGEQVRAAPEPRALSAVDLEAAQARFEEALAREGVPPGWRARIRAKVQEQLEAPRSTTRARDGLFVTPGFQHHREALAELVKKRPGEIYAFFAVDPRRRGAVEEVTQRGAVGKDGPFHGVKLYPMLGYHPQCKALEPLFDWCSETGTPIVSHCGDTGFPPWAPDREGLGRPANFRPILRDRKGLRIDFAHFGWMKDGWADEIVALMKEFPGQVFTDVAAYKDPGAAAAFKENFWDKEKETLARYTMLGSDFDVMLVTPPLVALEAYYRPFLAAFSREELDTMTGSVPRKFLGIG